MNYKSKIITPSWTNGFARSAGESAYPELWKGLVGAWVPALGPTGLTLHDFSSYKNNAILSGIIPSVDWLSCQLGYAIYFNGNSGTKGTISHNTILNLSIPFTISLSFGGFITIDNLVVLEKNSNSGYSIQIDSGKIQINYGYNGTGSIKNNVMINDNKFHVASFVLNNTGEGGASQYIDGKKVDLILNSPNAPAYGTNTPVYIGSRDGLYGFPGIIGNIFFHNRILLPNEISMLHSDMNSPFRLKPRIHVPVPYNRFLGITSGTKYFYFKSRG